jgi:predicted MFS family arabinose efflux permease
VAMGLLLFLAGFAIAPTLIAAVSFIEQTVPASRLTEGIAMLTTTIAAGIAPGAAVAGVVIDAHGPHTAYLVPICSGLIGVLAAVGTRAGGSIGSRSEHLDELVASGDGTADS